MSSASLASFKLGYDGECGPRNDTESSEGPVTVHEASQATGQIWLIVKITHCL